MRNNLLYFWGLMIFEILSILLLHLQPAQPIYVYTLGYILSSLIFIAAVWFLRNAELDRNQIFILLIVSIFLRISFIHSDPIGSDDVYRYMWDGKLQSYGINPYLYKPLDERLNAYHSDLLPAAMNFKEMRTIYFPVSQWLFYLGYNLSGENVWGYKFLLLIFELATMWLLFNSLAVDRRKFILIYALCPLPIIQFAVDAHLDGFGIPMLLAFFYYYMRNKKTAAALFLGLSFSIKPIGMVLLPLLFLHEKKLTDKIKMAVLPLSAFFIQFLPYIFNSNPFEAFLIYSKHWFYNGLIFNLLNSFIHNNQSSRMICSILLVLTLIPVYLSNRKIMDKFYFAMLLLIIFSPVVHPWYITWLLILVTMEYKWSGIWLASVSGLTAFTILNYKLNGIWKDYLPIQLLEYLPVFILFFFEFIKNDEPLRLSVRNYFVINSNESQSIR